MKNTEALSRQRCQDLDNLDSIAIQRKIRGELCLSRSQRQLFIVVNLKSGESRRVLVLVPRCIHFVDLFCGFLLIECSGKKLSEMPIKVCLHCRQLFAPPKKAEFCTRTCQWKHYWTPERRRDDIYVRRLEQRAKECLGRRYGFSMKDLQSMLVSRKVSERLNLCGYSYPKGEKPPQFSRSNLEVHFRAKASAGSYEDFHKDSLTLTEPSEYLNRG